MNCCRCAWACTASKGCGAECMVRLHPLLMGRRLGSRQRLRERLYKHWETWDKLGTTCGSTGHPSDLLLETDWLTRIDLKDAYSSVPIHQDHQEFPRFKWQEQQLPIHMPPFWPQYCAKGFTKPLKPLMTYLHGKGVHIVGCHLYRRHPSHSTIRGGGTQTHSHDSQPIGVTRLLSQLPESHS